MNFLNKKLRLGDILIQQGYISEQQLKDALEKQKMTKSRLGDCLVESGILTNEEIAKALNIQLGIAYVDLRGIDIPPEIIGLVSGSVLRKHNVIPIGYDEIGRAHV